MTLLNQGVMLKGVNDDIETQVSLSETLFDAGVLHTTCMFWTKVQGAAHFYISDDKARAIMSGVIERVSIRLLGAEINQRNWRKNQ